MPLSSHPGFYKMCRAPNRNQQGLSHLSQQSTQSVNTVELFCRGLRVSSSEAHCLGKAGQFSYLYQGLPSL